MCHLQCPPGCGCTVCLAWSVQWGGFGLWPVVTCPGSPSELGCQVPSVGYARASVRGMSAQAEWLVQCRPSLRRTPGDARCLCPGRYFHGPPIVVPRPPSPFWPMNMPEGAAGVRSPGKYSTRAGAGAFCRRGLWPVTVGGSIS